MRVPRVYTGQTLSAGQRITLEADPSHHLLKVLRLRSGEPVVLFNGDGKEYSAVLAQTDDRLATVTVSEGKDPRTESALYVELGQGISRGERMDFVLQKSVELGVHSVTPLWTTRSQVQLKGQRLEKRLGHWEGTIRSACEQSGRVIIPTLDSARTLTDWCSSTTARTRLVLDPAASSGLRDLPALASVAILIGPEGGLDDNEIEIAERFGFQRIRLGPRTLRTETAALAALAAVQALSGDLGS